MDGSPQTRWSGLCPDFHRSVVELGATADGRKLRHRAEARFMYAENKPFLLGPPQLIRPELADHLREVTAAYHRCIEQIIEASRTDEDVRSSLSAPRSLGHDLEADVDPANGKVHIMRLDLLPQADGGFYILETNANCPGGFVFAGICSRAWREFLEERGIQMPPALAHERKGFMADWFLDVIESDTGAQPDFLPLLREEGGNRFELTDFARHVRTRGLDCEEIDPRALTPCTTEDGRQGSATPDGRRVTHAYQKLGMQRFLAMRAELGPFVGAVRERGLFVQNGQHGRWVGDDKLCLAVLSDPAFGYLFEEKDRRTLADHIPWSRNLGRVDRATLDVVRANPGGYVLKRGLDTRGDGVLVGHEASELDWTAAVDQAVAEGWLVQAFHPTTWLERDFDSDETQRHDVALGAINGELNTLFMRSSGEMRVNMARTGRMHPLFMGA